MSNPAEHTQPTRNLACAVLFATIILVGCTAERELRVDPSVLLHPASMYNCTCVERFQWNTQTIRGVDCFNVNLVQRYGGRVPKFTSVSFYANVTDTGDPAISALLHQNEACEFLWGCDPIPGAGDFYEMTALTKGLHLDPRRLDGDTIIPIGGGFDVDAVGPPVNSTRSS